MHGSPLARTIGVACAIIGVAACESPERLVAPGGSRRVVVCEVGQDCWPPEPEAPPIVTPPIPLADRFGLVVHGDGAELTLAPLDSLGVRLVRFEIDWGIAWNWGTTSFVNTMNALRAHDIEVLANLTYRYDWEIPPNDTDYTQFPQCTSADAKVRAGCVPTGDSFWNVFLPQWKTFVGTMVRGVPQVRYWSAWNEPNEPAFFSAGQPYYSAMAKALCDTVRAVRAEPGGRQVYCVGPELAVHRPGQDGYGTEWAWLDSTMAAADFDIIAIHWYERIADVEAKVNFVKNRHPGKAVWVTESAIADPTWRVSAADPEFQERDLVAKWRAVTSGSGPIDALFYFDLQTRQSGIMQDYNPRPAYHALKRLNHSAYTDPDPGKCSTATGTELCAYTSWIPDGYGCRMDVYARRSSGEPVAGVTIAANEATSPWGYQELGTRKTNTAGVASFTAHCDRDHTARFVTGAGFSLGWWSPWTTSPAMHPTVDNRVVVYTFGIS